MTVSTENRATVMFARTHPWIVGTRPIEGEIVEAPIVSLRKMDCFFDRDDSMVLLPTLQKTRSTRICGFQDEERKLRIVNEGKETAMPMASEQARISSKTAVRLSSDEAAPLVEESMMWKKRLRRKARAPAYPTIVRPAMQQPRAFATLSADSVGS
jgi:hypothetical protein